MHRDRDAPGRASAVLSSSRHLARVMLALDVARTEVSAMLRFSKIVVGIDFSHPSLMALDQTVGLASQLGASVLLVHALEHPVITFPEETASDRGLPDRLACAQAALMAVMEDRASSGVTFEPVVRVGKAWQEIEYVADETGADLIVLGVSTHRRSVLRTLLGDNVTTTVVRTARTPVLTICSGPGERPS
jgi:nucleotide-binding universal stress UspA family protein